MDLAHQLDLERIEHALTTAKLVDAQRRLEVCDARNAELQAQLEAAAEQIARLVAHRTEGR